MKQEKGKETIKRLVSIITNIMVCILSELGEGGFDLVLYRFGRHVL